MTALAAVPSPSALAAREDDERAARLWAAIDEEFLTVMNWDKERQVVSFPQDHPLLGQARCDVAGCLTFISARGLCSVCRERWAGTTGLTMAEFTAIPRTRVLTRGLASCAVPDCKRPAVSVPARLCVAHDHQRKRVLRLPVEQFLAHPGVIPLAALGPCAVAACTRDREDTGPYCRQHGKRFQAASKEDPHLDVEAWRQTMPAIPEGALVSLRGLPVLAVAEALYGLQERIRGGIKTNQMQFRPYCDLLRRERAGCIADLDQAKKTSNPAYLHTFFTKAVRRLETNPEDERRKDTWDLFVFGHAGLLAFTGISQPWLREAAKRWAFDDLPRRRGSKAGSIIQQKIHSVGRLSDSLRLQRPDHGDLIGELGRDDITAFFNRLAFLAGQEQISGHLRRTSCLDVRQVLGACRSMGLTRPGQLLHGLPEDFTVGPDDIPDAPEEEAAGRDLPMEVMRVLTAHLDDLEAASGTEVRVTVELTMDTGRRINETATLMLDCLEADPDGKPILIYDNHKEHRKARRLPITAATAAIITAQQERVRARFPGTPASQLRLFPAPKKNPAGKRPVDHNWVSGCHRDWVAGLPDIAVPTAVDVAGSTVTKMLPFAKDKIVPHAYRHTYAQRHADAGVDVTVLKELMDHKMLHTTQTYYRVRDERRREAVDRVTAMQFDRHGNRVWRKAGQLLATEHQRRAVGEVAVPYGGCSEPSNVAADGCDCPLRFRCIGCGHFHTDISYLPDLERYLADLLRHQEKLRAAVDADEWARTEAMPSESEITRVRRLIERMKNDLDDLTADERAEIDDAVATVRRSRTRITHLGMPKVRQPLPDIHAERSA